MPNEQTQKRLAELKEASPRDFLEYCRYCNEMLGLDPNNAPSWYITQWLALPPQKRELGY